jgi:hypothetical protein
MSNLSKMKNKKFYLISLLFLAVAEFGLGRLVKNSENYFSTHPVYAQENPVQEISDESKLKQLIEDEISEKENLLKKNCVEPAFAGEVRKKKKKKLTMEEIDAWAKYIACRENLSGVIDETLIYATALEESRGDLYARSSKGAKGLFQLMNETGRKFSPDFHRDPYSLESNTMAGVNYLRFLEEFCEKNHPKWDGFSIRKKREFLVGLYNSGHGWLIKTNGDLSKFPKQSRRHIIKVMRHY